MTEPIIEVQREISRALEDASAAMAAEMDRTAKAIVKKAEAAGVSAEELGEVSRLIRQSLEGAPKGLEKRTSQADGRSASIAGIIASLGRLYDAPWVRCDSCGAVPKVSSMKCTAQQDGLYDLAAVEWDLKNWSTVENRSTKGPGERGRFCPECATARGISADALQGLPANRIIGE